MMKQYDYLSQLVAIRELRTQVRNWQEMRPNESWRWSCDVCGDSNRDHRKARFGLTRKGNSFVCNCFNCGYATNLVSYLRAYHPDQYRNVVQETMKIDEQKFDLDDLVGRVSNNVLRKLFFIEQNRDAKQWLNTLVNQKIQLSRKNTKKLLEIHKNFWS